MKNIKIQEMVLTALFAAIILVMAFTSLGYIPLIIINATIIHIPVIIGSLFLGPKKGALLGFLFGLTSFINNTFRAATASAFVFSPVIAYEVVGWTGILRSLYICFVPRILVGIVPYYVYRLFEMLFRKDLRWLRILIQAAAGAIFGGALFLFLKRLGGEDSRFLTIPVIAVIACLAGAGVFLFFFFTVKKHSDRAAAFSYAGLSGAFTNTFFVMSGIYILYKEAYAKALNISPDLVMNTVIGVVSFNGVLEAVVAAILTAGLSTVLLKVRPVYGTKA